MLCVSIAAAAAAAFFLFRYLDQKDIGRDDFTVTEAVEATLAPGETQALDASDAPLPDETEGEPLTAWGNTLAQMGGFNVDFDELERINPDVYAWIYIPNTRIDYPVARSTGDGNDSFYLEHNVYRQYQFSGTIFSEIANQPDMHDRVTVMYGHNMLNGTMFASLHYFEDKDFFDSNNTAFVLTKDKVFTYLIYSAYSYDNRNILSSFFVNDDDTFREYLDSTLQPHSVNENVREGVELTTEDKILTLSTCTNGASNTRYLVQGVLVDERNR